MAEGTLYFLKSAGKIVCTTGLQPAVFAVWRNAKIGDYNLMGFLPTEIRRTQRECLAGLTTFAITF